MIKQDTKNMNALLGFTVMLACILLVKPGDAVQCHQCSYDPFSSGNQQNCLDPFNTKGIATTTCEGRCFANYTYTESSGNEFEQAQRGCITDVDQCIPAFCQEFEATKYCSYCCDEDLCNSMGFEDAAIDTVNCWLCEANLTAGMEVDPASCGGDNFNGGDGALAIPCPGDKCMAVQLLSLGPDMPTMFARNCASEEICEYYEQTHGVEIDCCDGNLCNTGSINDVDGDDDNDDDDDDDDDGTIECWRCDSEITNKADEDTACGKGKFPADNVLKIDCPSGTCISYKYVGGNVTGKESQLFSRGCVTPDIERLGYCDNSNPFIKDAKCCTKTLCNGSAAVIALNAATMFSALIASLVCLYAMA